VLREKMHRLGLSPENLEIEPTGTIEDPRIMLDTVVAGAKLVYFHGHLDVVPVQHRARRDGKIVGRGTADMKGATALNVSSATRRPSPAPHGRPARPRRDR
jgi:succinyl-diaminopimelate desuccinylase